MSDAQLAHREAFGEVRDAAGTFRALNPPFRSSAAHAVVRSFVAALGEHSDEVLRQAGYTAAETRGFREAGVLG